MGKIKVNRNGEVISLLVEEMQPGDIFKVCITGELRVCTAKPYLDKELGCYSVISGSEEYTEVMVIDFE